MNIRGGSSEGDEARVELTPLIDVVFQLIIFFMLTMSFARNEYLIPVDLAQVGGGDEDQQSQGAWVGLTITVTSDGDVVLDGNIPLTVDELRERLVEVHDASPNAQVLLRGDKDAKHGIVLVVLDMVEAIGFSRVDMVVTRSA